MAFFVCLFCLFVCSFFLFFLFFFSLILYFWKSNLYSRFLIFAFGICCQFCTCKNPIFSTQFYVRARLLAWPLSPALDSPFSPPGGLCLLPPLSFLYPTLQISVCSRRWRTLREWVTGRISLSPFHFPLLSSWPPLSTSSLSSSLYNSVNTLSVPDCGAYIRKWLLASLLSLLLIPPLLIPVPSNYPLPLLFSM